MLDNFFFFSADGLFLLESPLFPVTVCFPLIQGFKGKNCQKYFTVILLFFVFGEADQIRVLWSSFNLKTGQGVVLTDGKAEAQGPLVLVSGSDPAST